MVYLDHAGATLYSEHQMKKFTEVICKTVLANPHSQSDASKQTNLVSLSLSLFRTQAKFCKAICVRLLKTPGG